MPENEGFNVSSAPLLLRGAPGRPLLDGKRQRGVGQAVHGGREACRDGDGHGAGAREQEQSRHRGSRIRPGREEPRGKRRGGEVDYSLAVQSTCSP